MSKLYKTYRGATRHFTADAVTLDGVKGFMPLPDIRIAEVLAEGVARSSGVQARHFVVVRTNCGLFGTEWFDVIGDQTIASKRATFAHTLFSNSQAAHAEHDATMARYASDARWTV